MSRNPSDDPKGPPAVTRTVVDLRHRVADLRSGGCRIAYVPTMGALHDGHLSLVRQAAAEGWAVVVSIFVNPTQFAPGEDFERYPRDEDADLEMLAAAGADLAFLPSPAEVYPDGAATRVHVAGPALGLEGTARPDHFSGVATVVAALVQMVRPDRLVMGQKDAQQVAVVGRMLRDLHMDDVELVVGPIVREPDGLAMSSRNAYLSAQDRHAALALSRGLRAAAELAAAGEVDPDRIASAAAALVDAEPRCRLEYAELVDPETFSPIERVDAPALLCVAARLGKTRLIDNTEILPTRERNHVPPIGRRMLKSKIHRATVTDANLDYVGSVTVDADLLDAADMRPYEQVQVLDINNGARFETYAIEGARGSGVICLNGAAARLVQPGDLVIILTYADYPESELDGFEPLVVQVDSRNRQVPEDARDTIPSAWEAAERSLVPGS